MILLANHGFPLKKGGILSTITQNRIRQQYQECPVYQLAREFRDFYKIKSSGYSGRGVWIKQARFLLYQNGKGVLKW